jgi:hypothetical protein
LVLVLAVVEAQGRFDTPWARYVAKGNKEPISEKIDFGELAQSGVRILEGFSGTPSKFGILKRYEVVLPDFDRGCYFSGDHHSEVDWPDGANRIQPWLFETLVQLGSDDYPRRPSNHPRVREGLFLLLKLKDGRYLAVTPIAGPLTMTWFYISPKGQLVLSFGTLGAEPVSCDAPLFAWCYSDDVYTACREAWASAITCPPVAGSTNFRKNKEYPEVFKYLGWCSWEGYKWDISEDVLLNVIVQIEGSGLPIRYLLVDDGHLDADKDRKLRSFNPNREKFPNGWLLLRSFRNDNKIRWMGLWNTTSGYWETISPQNQFGRQMNANLVSLERTHALVPRNDPAATKLFYDAHIGASKKHGFDFVKIDCQARNICWYVGSDNAVEATTNNLQALEAAVKDNVNGMINCMAHNLPCVFNTKYSAVTRCSIDYKAGKESRGKSHLLQSYSNALWLGQTVWCDHDMFHSSDPAAGKIMAISKAMSAGPVYLSDNPKDFVADYIRPLCYEDGELLRPLAPAAPLPDSVFIAPMREKSPYRVIAPLVGGAAAVVAYNLYDPAKESIAAAVTADDYTHASGMMQPYPGRSKVPDEGLVVYDWYASKATKLNESYAFELKGFCDRLLHLCPIRKGWAVIGRTDKYLSPAAVEVLSAAPQKLVVRMVESGPLAVWVADGVPTAKDVSFKDIGLGLWKADIEKGTRDLVLTIWKVDPKQ